MSLNLHLLRLFVTVVRTGSFSRAADVLNISQPAISKQIREFEAQVGCRLLDRFPRGVKATESGIALARHAETLFAAERAAEEELRALRGLEHGSLRIGASTTIATYMIADQIAEFSKLYPRVDVHLVSANTRDIAELMARHEIEIALVEGPIDDDNLLIEPWRRDVMRLIASPEHRFVSEKQPIHRRLIEDELLILREQGSGSREIVLQTLADCHVVPKRTLEIGSTEAIKQVVAAGVGVSIVSAATIQDQVALGKLCIVPVVDLTIERTLWRLVMHGRPKIPAAIRFEQIMMNDDTAPQVAGGIWPSRKY